MTGAIPVLPSSSVLSWTELEIASRLAAGDSFALAELMRRFWSPLIRYAVRMVGDLEMAKDISQEVFVRIWNSREGLWSGSVRSFIYRTAHNLAVDELRKRRVRAGFFPWDFPGGGREMAEPAEALEQKERNRSIARAVEALPHRRREILILAYFHNLSYQQIADQVGISPATVKNHLAAALSDLRRSLRPANLVTQTAD